MLSAPTTHDPFEAVAVHAAALEGTVKLARELVLAQRAVDLSGLDRDVGLLCARAFDLPPEQGSRAGLLLRTLAAAVDSLTSALKEAAGAG